MSITAKIWDHHPRRLSCSHPRKSSWSCSEGPIQRCSQPSTVFCGVTAQSTAGKGQRAMLLEPKVKWQAGQPAAFSISLNRTHWTHWTITNIYLAYTWHVIKKSSQGRSNFFYYHTLMFQVSTCSNFRTPPLDTTGLVFCSCLRLCPFCRRRKNGAANHTDSLSGTSAKDAEEPRWDYLPKASRMSCR